MCVQLGECGALILLKIQMGTQFSVESKSILHDNKTPNCFTLSWLIDNDYSLGPDLCR